MYPGYRVSPSVCDLTKVADGSLDWHWGNPLQRDSWPGVRCHLNICCRLLPGLWWDGNLLPWVTAAALSKEMNLKENSEGRRVIPASPLPPHNSTAALQLFNSTMNIWYLLSFWFVPAFSCLLYLPLKAAQFTCCCWDAAPLTGTFLLLKQLLLSVCFGTQERLHKRSCWKSFVFHAYFKHLSSRWRSGWGHFLPSVYLTGWCQIREQTVGILGQRVLQLTYCLHLGWSVFGQSVHVLQGEGAGALCLSFGPGCKVLSCFARTDISFKDWKVFF